ncbi:MAG: flotillin family protein [Myxococcales bacterium]|nr:flotillin family protein [Myxococcales bacterium]
MVEAALLIVLATFGVAVVVTSLVLWSCLVRVPPGAVVVISGRSHPAPPGADAPTLPFRVLTRGRALRIPILERADPLETQPRALRLELRDAYAADGEAPALEVAAMVRIGTDSPLLERAIERFLGRAPQEVATVAEQTLEGVLREVLSHLKVTQIREDVDKLSAYLGDDAAYDLEKLGLVVSDLRLTLA